ncbi:MAG: DUF4886 domain-containing protein [Nannocystales bacterium]
MRRSWVCIFALSFTAAACGSGAGSSATATDTDGGTATSTYDDSSVTVSPSSTSGSTSEGNSNTSSGGTTEAGETTGASSTSADESSSSGPAVVCDPPESLAVLFLGNSFTFSNDLPGMVSGLGEDAGIPIETDSLTQGGQPLSFHVQNEATLPILESQAWDYVVIQGHSLETLTDLDGFLQNGETLVGWIEEAGAEPLLYETWARSWVHDIWDDPNFGYTNPDEMQNAVSDGYRMLSDLTGARVVPAGQAWQTLWSSPDGEMYYPWGGDEYHPSVVGTYLNASVFFVALTGVSLDAVEGVQPVNEDASQVLHDIAEQVEPPCR